jgi:subtilisin family serine protease
MNRRRARVGTVLLAVGLIADGGLVLVAPATAAAPRVGRYVVRTTSAPAASAQVAKLRSAGVRITAHYTRVLNGYAGTLTAAQVRALRADPAVTSVTPAVRMSVHDIQTSPPWGLDRIDQRPETGDGTFSYDTTGRGVTAFVIDSGIRFSHSTFGGRAVSGPDFVDDDNDASDCEGHGTHVAGTLGGSTYGVAKQVRLVSLRVFDCNGSGYSDDVIAAFDWAVAHQPSGRSVVNFSGGGAVDFDTDAAVARTVQAGISVVVAAGNGDRNGDPLDACTNSPGRVPSALTVAASDIDDDQASFSNYGSCVDLFAPGVSVTSAGIASNTAREVLTGTSMSAPHVAGAVARLLQAQPGATPAELSASIVRHATPGALRLTDPNPNLLLFSSTLGRTYAPTGVETGRRTLPPPAG